MGGQQTARTVERQASRQEQSRRKKKRGGGRAGHRAAATKTARHKGGGWGAATTTEQPTARGKTQKQRERTKSREAGDQQNKKNTQCQGPGQPGPETRESMRQRGRKKKHKRAREERKTKRKGPEHRGPETRERRRQWRRATGTPQEEERQTRNKKGATPVRGGASKAERQSGQKEGEAQQNAPGKPARLTRPGRTSTRIHARDLGVPSSDPQGEVSVSTRNSPGAPAESSVEQRTVRETKRGSDRVNTRKPPQCTQPNTNTGGTRQGQPDRGAPKGYDTVRAQRPCLGGASGRHKKPGSRPASACPAQPPSKAGGASPRGGERHHGVGKADRSTESDRTG